MTIETPSDYELTFAFRVLVRRFGRINATYVWHRIWNDLAFQAQVHGKAGLYSEESIDHIKAIGEEIGVEWERFLRALTDSGYMKKGWGEKDLFCPLFFHYNGHLDVSWVPPTEEWFEEFCKMLGTLKSQYMTVHGESAKKVPQAAFYKPDGKVFSEATMMRGVMLIHVLDTILRRQGRARTIEALGIGELQTAAEVAERHSDLKIAAVLKRFMSVSRPKLNPNYPTTTEEALKVFDDLILMLMPDEGYDQWIKRTNETWTGKTEKTSSPENRKLIGRQVARELTDAMARVQP